MASILFYEIDRNYSISNKKSSSDTYGTLHQDIANDVSGKEEMIYNNNKPYLNYNIL